MACIDAQQFHRRLVALTHGNVKHDVLIGRHNQPRIVGQLSFQLVFFPSLIAYGGQGFVHDIVAVFGQVFDDVTRGGKSNVIGNQQAAFP